MDTSRDADQPLHTLGQVVGVTLALLLATVVFIMAISSSLQSYLQERLGPWLLALAVTMGALLLWTLPDVIDKLVGLKRDIHGHGPPEVAALLLLPALLFTILAPASLGADAASSTAVKPKSTISDTIEFSPLSTGSVIEMPMQNLEDRYTFGDPKLLVGRPVRLPGFVAKQLILLKGQWNVNRFRIYCCVADASLFTVPVKGIVRPEGDDIWVEVEGVINFGASGEHPVLTVSRVKAIQ